MSAALPKGFAQTLHGSAPMVSPDSNYTVDWPLALANGGHSLTAANPRAPMRPVPPPRRTRRKVPLASRGLAPFTRFYDDSGAVFVEFLLAFLPVYVFFLCVIQLGLLFAVRLGVEHAAANAARAAAVVIGDDPKRYAGEAPHSVQLGTSRRYRAISDAALLSLSPWVLNGTLDELEVLLPEESARDGLRARRERVELRPMHGGSVDKVRVLLRARAVCPISLANRIVCSAGEGKGALPGRTVRADAVFPYQGADYEYAK